MLSWAPCRPTTIATPIKCWSAKQGSTDTIYITVYCTPKGNSYRGRYNGDGSQSSWRTKSLNYECVDHVMQFRLHQEMPPCVGASIFNNNRYRYTA